MNPASVLITKLLIPEENEMVICICFNKSLINKEKQRFQMNEYINFGTVRVWFFGDV